MSVHPLVAWQPEAVFNFVHFLEATSHSARSWLWHSSKFIISRMGGFLADIKCQLLGWILIFWGIQYKFLGENEKMEGALFQRLCTLWIFRYRQMEIQEVFSTGRVDNRKILKTFDRAAGSELWCELSVKNILKPISPRQFYEFNLMWLIKRLMFLILLMLFKVCKLMAVPCYTK